MIWMNVNQTVKKEMKIFSKIFTEHEICDANYRARPVQLAGQNFNMRV